MCVHYGMEVPVKHKWGEGGQCVPVILEKSVVKITVDHCIPTAERISERRPDLFLTIKGENRIAILEVAVSWETRLLESEKKHKYRKLV